MLEKHDSVKVFLPPSHFSCYSETNSSFWNDYVLSDGGGEAATSVRFPIGNKCTFKRIFEGRLIKGLSGFRETNKGL